MFEPVLVCLIALSASEQAFRSVLTTLRCGKGEMIASWSGVIPCHSGLKGSAGADLTVLSAADAFEFLVIRSGVSLPLALMKSAGQWSKQYLSTCTLPW